MSDWARYQSDHLFLLIGSNPLPNYVAARLLVKPGGVTHLVHSADTEPVARRLSEAISGEVRFVPISEADPHGVFRKVRDEASGKMGLHLGLNYTGGTKVMCVHAYRAVADVDSRATFSYLDARTLQMKIDRCGELFAVPAENEVRVSLEALTKMHGCVINETRGVRFLIEAARLAQSDYGAVRAWCDTNLRIEHRKLKKGRPARAVDVSGLPAALQDWRSHESLGGLALEINEEPDKLVRWLDGNWLEDHVCATIRAFATDLQLSQCLSGIKMTRAGLEFEFDVAAMRGYQLFAISCTTSLERNLIKSKLFEAYVRAAQMGGDEARVAAVSCAKVPSSIQEEVEEAWDAKGKVRVFGAEHLPNLGSHLRGWFLEHS